MLKNDKSSERLNYYGDKKYKIHGGEVGFDKKVWMAGICDGDEPTLMLSLINLDGDAGFPQFTEVLTFPQWNFEKR